MRNLMTTVAVAAALTIGSISMALAAAPTTGNEIIDSVLAEYYQAVESACTPSDGVAANASACEAALRTFAALSTPESLATVPAIAAAISNGTLPRATFDTAVASNSFANSFLAANTALGNDIRAANADNPAFLIAISDTASQTLGVNTAAGGDDEGSPTLAN